MTQPSDGVRLIRALRLRNQGLVPGVQSWRTAADVARHMVAMQAQDLNGVLFALSLRAADRPAEKAVRKQLDSGSIVRNRPSRGTLQVTAPEDLHWLSELMAPRSNAAAVKRRDQIGVTEDMIQGVGEVLHSQLGGGRTMTRPDLVTTCAADGIELDGSQAGHVLRHHTEMMTIVFAGTDGRVDRFALGDEWIHERRELDRPAGLVELATRFFSTRGPATPQCLGWWANLPMGDVRKAIDSAGDALEEISIDGVSFLAGVGSATLTKEEVDAALAEPLLLPPFDEYLLGYRSRDPVITPQHLDAVVPGRNGMFKPIVVVDGEIVGLWSRKATKRAVELTVEPFADVSGFAKSTVKGLTRRAEEYGSFVGLPATLTVAGT